MKHSDAKEIPVAYWQKAGFGLYVHWPFCTSKCPYCDFNSHVASRVDYDEWRSAFGSELERLRSETGPRALSSIFFGGGTPSLMPGALVEHIISEAGRHWSFSNDIEITLEANPGSVEREKFRDFRLAGVNRVSIGVQALNDQDLRRLGRMHTAQDALRAIELAGTTFDRFSFDLIYARQDQSLADWESELRQAISLGARHLSLYQLTIEPETVFGERYARGLLSGLPDEDISADMYSLTQEICAAEGLPAYETSNHAAVGEESRHNLIYWRSGDFAAVGPGAHGRLTDQTGLRCATESERFPDKWLQKVKLERGGLSDRQFLTDSEKANEFIVMGLRLSDGIDLDDMEAFCGHSLSRQSVASLEELGMIKRHGSRISTTLAGRMLLNSVLAQFEIIPARQ